jgi:hypothetical protein
LVQIDELAHGVEVDVGDPDADRVVGDARAGPAPAVLPESGDAVDSDPEADVPSSLAVHAAVATRARAASPARTGSFERMVVPLMSC